MSFPWNHLDYWSTGECSVVLERLADLRKAGTEICPARTDLFKALSLTSFEACKVMFCGQDPYPNPRMATGLTFSTPPTEKVTPPTLGCIFDEYESDLHYPRPATGDLSAWSNEGVLLWNVVPSCTAGHSLSHDWEEWSLLTTEIINKLKQKGIVFVFFGTRAREYAHLVNQEQNCRTIEVSHPSPRATLKARNPFTGSRIFTRVNDALNELKLSPIDWRL